MAGFGSYGTGFSLKALLEDPNLQNPPSLIQNYSNLKKPGKHGGYIPNAQSAVLIPNLWEKPAGEDGDNFDLEYMDLDEFLTENGIPINPDENDDAQTISMLARELAKSPTAPRRNSPVMIGPLSPKDDQQPLDHLKGKEISLDNSTNSYYMPMSPHGPQSMSPLNINISPMGSPSHMEQSAIEKCLLDFDMKCHPMSSPPLITSPLKSSPLKTSPASSFVPLKVVIKEKVAADISFTVIPEDLSLATVPVFRQGNPQIRTPPLRNSQLGSPPIQSAGNICPPPVPQNWDNTNTIVNEDLECMTNNSVPGQDNFDPTARKFSEEELKPQPIIKKSKKVFVHDTHKDDKYWNRRNKNNVAAKRSRDARRIKENQIAMRASFLEAQHDAMSRTCEQLQKENEALIKRLSKYEKV